MTPNEKSGKLDPFDPGTHDLADPQVEGEQRDTQVKRLNPRVVVAAGTMAFIVLAAAVTYMGVSAQNARPPSTGQADDSPVRVTPDPDDADLEATRRLEQAEQAATSAPGQVQGQDDALALGPSTSGAPDGAPGVPTPSPALSPGGPEATGGSPQAPKEDPWVVARRQYVATQAQQHYTLMAQARLAPIFKGDGIASAGGGGQAGRAGRGAQVGAGGDDRDLPAARNAQEAEYLDRLRRARARARAQGAPDTPGAQVGFEAGVGALGAGSTLTAGAPVMGAQASMGGFVRVSTGAPQAGATTRGAGVACRPGVSCVLAGTLVHAVLSTPIDSTQPGMVKAQVSQPVWDPGMSHVVVPSGSTLLGEYDTTVGYGMERVQVAWTRLILPDGRAYELGRFPATGLSGASGLPAEVDEHWDSLLAGAGLSAVFAASSAATSGTVNQLAIDPRQQAINGGVRPLQQLGEERSNRYLEAGPTLRVAHGAHVGMLVPVDIMLGQRWSVGVFGKRTQTTSQTR